MDDQAPDVPVVDPVPPPPEAPATKAPPHSIEAKLCEIEQTAEKWLGGRSWEIKKKLEELRRLL